MKINWPKVRLPKVSVPDPVRDLERLARQLGISQSIAADGIEQVAWELAKSELPAWVLSALARACSRAAAIKRESP